MYHKMIRHDIVLLVHLGMWYCRAIKHGFIVSKNVANIVNRDSQVSKGIPMINNLLNASSSGNEFSTVCSGLRSRLLLTIPINRSLVVEMKDSGHCLAGQYIVH